MNKSTIWIIILFKKGRDHIEQVEQLREYTRLLERKLELLNSDTQSCCCQVTLAECHALVEIGRSKNISLKELAKIIGVDVSTTSKAVEGLVKKNLVCRKQSTKDRRSIEINLAEEGKLVFEKIESDMNNKFAKVFSNIPDHQKESVLNALKTYIDAFE